MATDNPYSASTPLDYASYEQSPVVTLRLGPHLILQVLFGVAAMYWGGRLPAGLTIETLIGGFLLLIVCLTASFNTLKWIFEVVRVEGKPRLSRKAICQLILIPALVSGIVIALRTDLPYRSCLILSRNAMNRYAKARLQSLSSEKETRWVGLYKISDTELCDGGVRFRLVGAQWDRVCFGLMYCPTATPKSTLQSAYRSLGDGWYEWSFDKD